MGMQDYHFYTLTHKGYSHAQTKKYRQMSLLELLKLDNTAVFLTSEKKDRLWDKFLHTCIATRLLLFLKVLCILEKQAAYIPCL